MGFNFMVIKMTKSLVYGFGVNDADYSVRPRINGGRTMCRYYAVWVSMLLRCYDATYQSKRPTYRGCSVCEDWLTFSNFKKWMETQDWKDKELDKDFIVKGNKIYSPDFCCFVDRKTNAFITSCFSQRGELLTGARPNKRNGKFYAECRNPFTNKAEKSGHFKDELSAHLAWKEMKHQLACQLADLQSSEKAAKALRTMFL